MLFRLPFYPLGLDEKEPRILNPTWLGRVAEAQRLMHEVPVQGHGGIVQEVGEDGVPAKRCYECRHIGATKHQECHDLSWEKQKLLGKTCQLPSSKPLVTKRTSGLNGRVRRCGTLNSRNYTNPPRVQTSRSIPGSRAGEMQ